MSPSAHWEGTKVFILPAVMGNPQRVGHLKTVNQSGCDVLKHVQSKQPRSHRGWNRDTGGEVTWKPVGTSWVNCGLWIIFPPMYPPITFWVHLDCGLNICPACTHQITFKMLQEMVPKYSCDMSSHTQGWSSNVPSIYSIVFHVPSMYPERVACSQNTPRTSSMFPKYTHWTYPRNIFDNICGSWFECYW